MDALGRVIQAVPVEREPCPFPKWTTKGYTIELREIYSAVHDHYLRLPPAAAEKRN
jgi:hypothetical protein